MSTEGDWTSRSSCHIASAAYPEILASLARKREGKEDERKKREANAAKNDEPVSNGNAKGSHRINLGLCTNFG